MAGAATETMPTQLTLQIGGATVDTSMVGGMRWAKDTRDLPGEFKKGSDVELVVRCRVVEVGAVDKYDAHGNIAETIRKHVLRVDELVSSAQALIDPKAWRTQNAEPEDNGSVE